MNKIIDYCAKHPVSALMCFFLAILLGAASAFCINTSLLPQTKDRWILAVARYEGVRAEEIKKLVAIPLEESLASLKDGKSRECVCRDGICSVKIELKWSADPDAALLEANSIVDSAIELLPNDCQRPQVQKLSAHSGKVKICVAPQKENLLAASDFAQNELKSKLLSIKECSSVEIEGCQKQEIKVIVDSKKSAFYALSVDDIRDSLNLSNYDYPAGTIQDGRSDILFKTEGSYKSFSEILDTPIKKGLKLKDIGRVEKSLQKSKSFFMLDAKPCAAVTAFCKKGQNPLALSAKIKSLCEEINSSGRGIRLIVIDDNGKEILQSLKNLFLSALMGIGAAFVLILIFFKSAKIALLAASAIPMSALFTFLVLFALGKSLNVISMAGVTLCLGMIVDNGIVALESLLEENGGRKKSWSEEIASRIKKIALANSASTLTTIIVFIPIFFIGGIIGELFSDLGISVISGMIFSLIFSFTALPALCVLFLKNEIKKAKKIDLSFIQRRYDKILLKTNKIKGLCPAASLVFLAAAFTLLVPAKKELQPRGREKDFSAAIVFEPGAKKYFLERKTAALSEEILSLEKGVQVIADGGFENDNGEALADAERPQERIVLRVKGKKLKKLKAACERLFKAQGLDYNFLEEDDLISERLGIKSQCLYFEKNEEALLEKCEKLFGKDFFPNRKKTLKVFKANKNKMKMAGISPLSLSSALKSSFDGSAAFPYYENGKEIPLRVQFEENEFSSPKNLDALMIPSQKGMIRLSSLGEWKEESVQCVHYLRNGKEAKIVSEKTAKNALNKKESFVSLKKEKVDELFANAFFLLLVVLALLYCLLGAETESFFVPLVYLLSVPPAIFGGALFIFIFRSSLNVNSIMAFVALFGTSVNSSIILREGGRKKFSSVLITTGTSLASLLPFAIDPLNLNPQSSLALTISGGLLFSSAASLILIPNITEKK